MDISNYLDEAFNSASKSIGQNIENTFNEVKEAINDKLNEEYFLNNKPTESRNVSLFNRICSENNISAPYRDKMLVERGKLIRDYAKETADKGPMYYIYDTHSQKENVYLMSICEYGRSHEVFEIEKKNLPYGAGVDSFLRSRDDKFELDKEATTCLKEQMKEIFERLLKEQNRELTSKRIEGHIYKIMETSNCSATLLDLNEYPKVSCGFEDFEFPSNYREIAQKGDLFVYKNGGYEKCI